MNDLETRFYEYIDCFKKLNTANKRDEVLNSIKELIVSIRSLAQFDNIELTSITNRESKDLDKGNESEDDYLEALLSYLELAKINLGEYLDNKI